MCERCDRHERETESRIADRAEQFRRTAELLRDRCERLASEAPTTPMLSLVPCCPAEAEWLASTAPPSAMERAYLRRPA